MSAHQTLRLTGALPAKDVLSVVTLSWNGTRLYLVPSATAFFTLESDDQAGVRQLARDVWEFCRDRAIVELLVRRGPPVGPRQVATGTTKIETILQLMPLTCAHVNVQRISGWLEQKQWLLPLPQPNLRVKLADVQQRAIETAAFGIACVIASAL